MTCNTHLIRFLNIRFVFICSQHPKQNACWWPLCSSFQQGIEMETEQREYPPGEWGGGAHISTTPWPSLTETVPLARPLNAPRSANTHMQASDRVTHGGTEAAVNLQIKGQRLHENLISARGLARFSICHLRIDLRVSFHFYLLQTQNLTLKSHFLFLSGHDGQKVIKKGNLARRLQSCEYF